MRLGGLAMVMLGAMIVSASAAEPAKGPGFQQRVYRGPDGQEVKYALFVPRELKKDRPLPIILFLHGAGETGTDGEKQTRVGLGKAIREREATFPFLVVFPQAQKREPNLLQTWWPGKTEGDRALAILAAIEKEFGTDPKRVYLTGISMGGFGTWAHAVHNPGRWAALAPVCGGGDADKAKLIRDLPCWCFHGDRDPAVAVSHSRKMIDALKLAGGKPRYTEYPGVAHNCWDRAYATDELYTWLLEHTAR